LAPAHAIVIFGCAVLPDGRSSPALARRIGYGVRAAADAPAAPVVCSGAAGTAGPSEASVMATALISAGVDPGRLVLDEASRDTLQSAAFCARFIRAEGLAGCIVCSDGYHLPRIRLILWALGVQTRPGPLSHRRGGASLRDWALMSLREVPAIPYDLMVAIFRRRDLLAAPGPAVS
jgi:uncharacterized SAM-binding protein YcdF (DUF218 family)